MIDTHTDRVVMERVVRRTEFITGKSVKIRSVTVVLMDNGTVRAIWEKDPNHYRVTRTSSVMRMPYETVVEFARNFERDYITEEKPEWVRP
ncbi:hypothetical protein [Streptomyces hydrogenans]|uniref:hypothetical protein n=1 Tax=Streptomyces hydrogenans TaxID=1873719 RepID=UPI0035D9C095